MRRYYQILGVSPSATAEQIRDAYLFSLKAFHPDKFAGSSQEQQRIAHERTQAINEAYSVLSDSVKRADYDRDYARQFSSEQPRPASAPPPPPPPRRKPPPPPPPTAQAPAPSEPKIPTGLNKLVPNYLLVRGRTDRLTFIVRVVLIFGAMVLLVLVGTTNSNTQAIFGIALLICTGLIAVQAGKRLHDINSSAGWVFAGVTGLGALALSFILPFAPGTKGPNRYGPQAFASRGTKIGSAIIFAVALIGLIVALVRESNKGQTTSAATNSGGMRFSSLSPTPSRLTNNPGLQLTTPKFDLTQPTPPQTRTVEGSDIHYSLAVPNEWIVKRKQELSKEQEDFDLVALHKTVYVAVIAEEPNLGDVDTVVSFSRKLLSEKGSDVRLSTVETTSIDGRRWRTFNAHAAVNKIPLAYQFYVYTGPEGTFQLIGWTFENLFDREAPQIRAVLQSFKFPQSTNSTNTAVLPQESPATADTLDGQTFDLPTLAKNARPAVLLLVGFDNNGNMVKSGSGFFVSRTGRIVTNWHVVDGVTTVAAKTEGGAIYNVLGVLAYSINLDLAILKAEADNVPFLPLEKTQTSEAGTKIAVIGSPHALEGTLSEGIVSAVRKGDDGTWIQMTAPVSPGSSGSPVLNEHGRVIGVATLNSTGRYQNLNFARSAYDLSILVASIRRGEAAKPFGQVPAWASRQSAPSLSPSPTVLPAQTPTVVAPAQDDRPMYIVVASAREGLYIRSEPDSHSKILKRLMELDHVYSLGKRIRNTLPPPTLWQAVTSMDGVTGWINAAYITPMPEQQQADSPSPSPTVP